MLLGMLNVLPTGTLAISDLTASISLDLAQAAAIPEDSAWFTPGMIVLIDGVYEEEEESVGRGLAGSSGVGGNIGGKFRGLFVGQPPCEKRRATFGVSGLDGGPDHTVGGGFGWIDFLGVGSERAVGSKMRKLETRLMHRPASSDPDTPGRGRIIILGELNLDQPRTLQALRKVLSLYAAEPEGSTPLSFVLAGNFAQHAVMARGGSGGSIEYKEYFDGLASTLSDFPTLLQASTFVFVPGDNDGWASSFSAGGAVPLPRQGVPDMFTSRIRRAFATANAEPYRAASGEVQSSRTPGEAVWTSNPSRLSLFGPNHEIVVFRDDISARLRRAAVRLKMPKSQEANGDGANGTTAGHADETAVPGANTEASVSTETYDELEAMEVDSQPAESDGAQTNTPESEKLSTDTKTARKLVKTVLDQGYLAPFRQAIRPVHWDFGSAMHLYPLPTALVLVDTTAPAFCITYEGCHVMNPGGLLVSGRRGVARWIEYEVGKLGKLRECLC
jgi:DNA polymerase epsilon subunit 2